VVFSEAPEINRVATSQYRPGDVLPKMNMDIKQKHGANRISGVSAAVAAASIMSSAKYPGQ